MINHISPSMLGLFCRCQEAFRRRYIEGIKLPPGIAACIGTGMHKGAEANHRQKIESGVDMPLGDIQDAARDGYNAAISDGVFVPEGEESSAPTELAKGVDTAVNLAAAYARHIAPRIQPVAVEERLQSDVPGLPVPFLGIIDVLDGSGWCPDLKSAARKWAPGKAAGNMQPAVYRYLLQQGRGVPMPRMSFEIVTHKGEHQSIMVDAREEDLAPVIARANGLLAAVERGDFLPAEPGHWMCGPKWCGYWHSCPYIPEYKRFARSAA